MAPSKKPAEDSASQGKNMELREQLQNAYSFVEGQKSADTFKAFTFEDALNNEIERLTGSGVTENRPSQIDKIKRIQREAIAAINRIRNTPNEQFVSNDKKTNVNT